MAAPCCSVRASSVAGACLVLLAIVSCSYGQLNLYITRAHLQSNIGLDMGNDIYLIQDGKTGALLTNPVAFKHFMSPLPAQLKEIEFSWRSHPLQVRYSFELFSSDEDILSVPHLSIPKTGTVPLYDKVFALYLECDGKKFGLVEVEMRLNYTTLSRGHERQQLFRIQAKKLCPKEDSGRSSVMPPVSAPNPSLSEAAIYLIAAGITIFFCLAGCFMFYRCYRIKTKKLHIQFDSDYELNTKQEIKHKRICSLEQQDDLFDELDTPPKPIFVRKNRHEKKRKRFRHYHRHGSSHPPLEGTPPPAYSVSPTSPLSPSSAFGLLANIPEEFGEHQEDDYVSDERQPILTSEREGTPTSPPHFHGASSSCHHQIRQPVESCIVSISDLSSAKESDGKKQNLYEMLNKHWKLQFADSLLSNEQVIVDKNALGKGTFGCVFCGNFNGLGDGKAPLPVAVKTLRGTTDFAVISSFVEEAVLMKTMTHPHVMPLVGLVLQEASPPMLVMPYMKFGDLNQFLRNARPTPRKPQSLSTRQLINFGFKIAQGMEYISSLNIVHRDLTTRNCMVNEEYDVVIGDFGLAVDLSSSDQTKLSSKPNLPVKWSAIELLTSNSCSEKSDVWSFGVCLWELMTLGKQPYSNIPNDDLETHLLHGKRLLQTHNCPSEMYEIMLSCWKHDPSERYTFSELCFKLSAYESRYRQYILDARIPHDAPIS